MERWNGRVALVTGASMGIGEAICRSLVKCGLKVVGCARSFDKLQKLEDELKDESGSFHPVKCDLRDEDEILKMFRWIKDHFKGVDICVNNAGMALNSPLGSGDTEAWRCMLDLNVLALSICSREAVQSMKSRGVNDGHIVNINSMSGHRVISSPAFHFYSATKYAVTGLTAGLRNELRLMNSRIRITSISPGKVDTNFFSNVYPNKPKTESKGMLELESKDISDAVIYILSAPPHVEVNDIHMRPVDQKH
ncbi:dehydrogenase/reductase SDR family member 11-like [Tubulanus polymorphus]|uniref:dehydrogenase/reductase SDR family member 11-like n=1 Tax=Tubulanus polymorphus TaxID=672921 RepID=UPI003DA6090F